MFFGRSLVVLNMKKILLIPLMIIAAHSFYAEGQTNLPPGRNPIQSTNSDTAQVESKPNVSSAAGPNTNLNKDHTFKLLADRIRRMTSDPRNNWDDYEQTARELIKEFPDERDGYDALIDEMQFGDRKRAVMLAEEMEESSAPQAYKLWAKGFVRRAGLLNKPVTLQFVAIDGREVDLSKMRGKVVLIDFWGTACVPCVAELPQIRAAYDKFHKKGFEVIGISFDTDQARLQRFIKEKGLPWPQAFDAKQGVENKYGQEFGICAIPAVLVLDKNGCLRLGGNADWPRIEKAVTYLLAEP